MGEKVAAAALTAALLLVAAAPASAKTADGPVLVQADAFTTLGQPPLGDGQIELTTTSTRPSIVTGDLARMEVRGLSADDTLKVSRNGTDVTSAFTVRRGTADGLVTALKQGKNTIVATATGAAHGKRVARLTVTAHSLQGPILSGPHQYPFGCRTEQSGLGKATSKDCEAPEKVSWYARTFGGSFVKLADPYAAYPSGTLTTDGGKPFVVRVQSRVINRSVTRIAVLDDPHARGKDKPFAPVDWNHKLLYQFGESCGTGYSQGDNQETSPFGALADISGENIAGPFLDMSGHIGQGWMVAVSTLTIFGVHCNPVLSAETLTMVKEHIIDDYGDVDHVVSGGASGGAIQQYTAANQYPGLIDAGVPILSFPDVATTAMTVTDCIGFQRLFRSDPKRWNDLKQRAVTGLATPMACNDWVDLFGDNIKPTNCDGSVPKEQRYDKVKNPRGIRCSLQDSSRNVYGVDPKTGWGHRPADNTGVIYGLSAFKRGDISFADLVELNQDIGGLDADGEHQSARHAMSEATARRLWQTGQVSGRGPLNQTPIIDVAIPVSDYVPQLDIHDQIRPYGLHARLDNVFGSHVSQSIWTVIPLPASAVDTADAWLNAIDALRAKNPHLSREQLVAQAKPAGAGDQCRLGVVGIQGTCEAGVIRHSSPRQQAGMPFSEDVVKCHLKPLATGDFGFSQSQARELYDVFKDGVCDWSKPSVGVVDRSLTWLSYGDPDKQEPPKVIPYTVARSGPEPRACARARRVTLHPRRPKGSRVLSATLLVAGKRVRTVRSSRGVKAVKVDLRKRRAGRVTVTLRLRVRTASGRLRTVSDRRTYRLCAAR